jgi:hypothetical protein
LVAAMRGKRQMLPVPTAIPKTLNSNPMREEKRSADASEVPRLSVFTSSVEESRRMVGDA